MSLRRPVLAALAAALALAPPLHAQGRAEFTGRVVDAATGTPVSRAIVTLRGGHGRAVTDAQGRFSVARVAEGPYLATVERLGYGGMARAVEVAAGAAAEFRLQPDPLVLEGIAVNASRLESRRRRSSIPVRTVEADELARSPFSTVAVLLAGRMVDPQREEGPTAAAMLRRTDEEPVLVDDLPPDGAPPGAMLRGRIGDVSVFVDEVPAFGGLRELEAYAPQDVFLIEAYGGGRQVRVYTNQYMTQLAVSGRSPEPMILW